MPMDPDEVPGKKSSGFIAGEDVKVLSATDLEPFSAEALQDRISILKEEIVRCEAAIESKSGARNAAEALFK